MHEDIFVPVSFEELNPSSQQRRAKDTIDFPKLSPPEKALNRFVTTVAFHSVNHKLYNDEKGQSQAEKCGFGASQSSSRLQEKANDSPGR